MSTKENTKFTKSTNMVQKKLLVRFAQDVARRRLLRMSVFHGLPPIAPNLKNGLLQLCFRKGRLKNELTNFKKTTS